MDSRFTFHEYRSRGVVWERIATRGSSDYMLTQHMKCRCGAIVSKEEVNDANQGLVNAYLCLGGKDSEGRCSPAHFEPFCSVEEMTREAEATLSSEETATLEEKSEAINLAIAAAPGLYDDMGIMHPEGVQIGYFLEAFCQENLGEFCHQVPLEGYGELILTSMESKGGMLPAAIDINGVQILRFQLRDLLDLHNLTLWSQGVFYSGNDE